MIACCHHALSFCVSTSPPPVLPVLPPRAGRDEETCEITQPLYFLQLLTLQTPNNTRKRRIVRRHGASRRRRSDRPRVDAVRAPTRRPAAAARSPSRHRLAHRPHSRPERVHFPLHIIQARHRTHRFARARRRGLLLLPVRVLAAARRVFAAVKFMMMIRLESKRQREHPDLRPHTASPSPSVLSRANPRLPIDASHRIRIRMPAPARAETARDAACDAARDDDDDETVTVDATARANARRRVIAARARVASTTTTGREGFVSCAIISCFGRLIPILCVHA